MSDTVARKTSARNRAKQWSEHSPVDDYRVLDLPPAGEVAPYFRDWVQHDTNDAYGAR